MAIKPTLLAVTASIAVLIILAVFYIKDDTSQLTNEDVLSKMKTLPFDKIGTLFIVIMSIIALVMLFGDGTLKTKTKPTSSSTNLIIVSNTFIVISFIVVVYSIIRLSQPDILENSIKLKNQFFSTVVVFLYTIAFTLFFLSMSKDILDKYANLIVPFSVLLTAFVFIKAFKSKYTISYERIKSLILFVCLIAIIIVYYNVDPGGIIQKYFGYSMLLILIMSAFALMFMVLTFSISNRTLASNIGSEQSDGNNLTYISIFFFLFILMISIGSYYYPGGINSNPTAFFGVIVITIIITLVVGIGVITNTFPETIDEAYTSTKESNATKTLLIIFGIIISTLFISFIMYNLKHTNAFSFFLNLMLILVVLTFIYKTVYVEIPGKNVNAKKNAFFSLVYYLIMYIPCLLSDLINYLLNTKNHDAFVSFGLLIVAIFLSYMYYKSSVLEKIIALQGGKLLLANPISVNKLNTLASYSELNGSNKFHYQYGISFWIYLNTFPTSTSQASNNFVSLLNYGGKPNILYRASTNTLMITMDQTGLTPEQNKLIDFDEDGNRIIYTQENVLLQKWNNIVINYYGGTLDVFFNNELVKSAVEVVPYMKLDSLTVGSNNGILASICNVQYFDTPISTTNMYILYNSVKNNKIPVVAETNKTLIPFS